jgi:hypothetical protein
MDYVKVECTFIYESTAIRMLESLHSKKLLFHEKLCSVDYGFDATKIEGYTKSDMYDLIVKEISSVIDDLIDMSVAPLIYLDKDTVSYIEREVKTLNNEHTKD